MATVESFFIGGIEEYSSPLDDHESLLSSDEGSESSDPESLSHHGSEATACPSNQVNEEILKKLNRLKANVRIGGKGTPRRKRKLSRRPFQRAINEIEASINALTLENHIFTEEGWKQASAPAHPRMRLRLTTCEEDYLKFGIAFPRIQPKHIDVVVDSGAQSCLWSRESFLKAGFCLKDLIPVRHNLKAANTAPIKIDGAILIRLSGTSDNGDCVEAAVMTYISPDTNNFYLSRECMIQLGIINKDFPKVGTAFSSNPDTHENIAELAGDDTLYAACGCLKRELPPEKPTELPFECIPENADKMKTWLLTQYASSTFNKCPYQDLPEMEGPPIQIHVDPNATPICLKKPAPVALHWQEQVEKDLNKDVALGVLERVPLGEPTKWCFKMVVTRKEDGSPRRTVDLSPMNKHCVREVHTSKSSFSLARSVPDNSFKTVYDAWNGFHSVPIREEDRHLTTFTTPWGLFRYKRAPQGFLSSGDGYNRRFDDLTAHIPRTDDAWTIPCSMTSIWRSIGGELLILSISVGIQV